MCLFALCDVFQGIMLNPFDEQLFRRVVGTIRLRCPTLLFFRRTRALGRWVRLCRWPGSETDGEPATAGPNLKPLSHCRASHHI